MPITVIKNLFNQIRLNIYENLTLTTFKYSQVAMVFTYVLTVISMKMSTF